jgi:hypothetical protein
MKVPESNNGDGLYGSKTTIIPKPSSWEITSYGFIKHVKNT